MLDAPTDQVLTQPEDTTPGKAAADLVVPGENTGEQSLPPRPTVNPTVEAFVTGLWKETTELPAFDEAVKAAREAQKTLFPAWHDKGDRWLGKVPLEKRTRREDRMVRTPHIFIGQKQAIAQTVPEDHTATWKPKEKVRRRDDQVDIIASDAEERWAETIRIGTTTYLREAALQEWLEAFVQDAKSYPIAVLKMTFQRDWGTDPLNGVSQSGDEQDSTQRVRVMIEEVRRGNLTKDDPRWLELHQLIQTLGGKSELELFQGFRISTVPINAFRAPDSCRDPLTIYQQPWLADDTDMTVEEIRTKFPFIQKPAGADGAAGEWTGVHPDDLDTATKGDGTTAGSLRATGAGNSRDLKRRSTRRGAGRADQQVKATLIVREVWHRLTNTVYVLVEGISYPVAKWVPERQHDEWFPYIVFVPNRITNDLYGISDVELQADIQHRRNRKATDEEKARWLGLPRDFFDTSVGDADAVRNAFRAAKPGEITGLPLGGKPIEETIHRLAYDHKPEAFDTTRDEQDQRLAARMPEQTQGVTGRAKFAKEVEEAARGNEVATAYDQSLYRRFLVRVYHRAAQTLIFELDADDWREACGEYALIPEMATEEEVRSVRQAIRQEAMEAAVAQVMQMAQTDATLANAYGQPDQVSMKRRAQDVASQIEKKLCDQRYGPEGLISREGLYRRLHCEVDLSVNGSLDRDKRLNGLSMMGEIVRNMAEAARVAGKRLDPGPLIRRVAQLTGEQAELDAMFSDDPNALAADLVQILAQGEQLDQETVAMLTQVLGPIMAAQMQQQQAANAAKKPTGEGDAAQPADPADAPIGGEAPIGLAQAAGAA
jgi:hypothetical protein